MKTKPRPHAPDAIKILVVDDSADLRRAIRVMLGPGYEVLEAGSGREAMRLARRESPRLILLDLGLPDADGLSVLRSLRSLSPAIDVVMLTGNDSLDAARAALQCGARSYVTKPFDPDALCGEVGRLTEGALAREAGPFALPWRVAGLDAPGA